MAEAHDKIELSPEALRQAGVDPDSLPRAGQHSSDGAGGRPWISVYFECCRVYSRVYRNACGTAYVGWCPRCAGKVTVSIGSDGSSCRVFRAG